MLRSQSFPREKVNDKYKGFVPQYSCTCYLPFCVENLGPQHGTDQQATAALTAAAAPAPAPAPGASQLAELPAVSAMGAAVTQAAQSVRQQASQRRREQAHAAQQSQAHLDQAACSSRAMRHPAADADMVSTSASAAGRLAAMSCAVSS